MIVYAVGDDVIRVDNDSFLQDLQTYKVVKFLYRDEDLIPYLIEVADDNGTPCFFEPNSLRKEDMGDGLIVMPDEQVETMLLNQLEAFTPEVKGIKYDPDKLQYSLIPPYALEEVAKNLTIGLKKYPHRDNWKLVQDAEQRYLDALIRHLEAHRKGEVFDPDNTSVYHLAAVAVNAMFLLEFMTNPELDSKVFNKE